MFGHMLYSLTQERLTAQVSEKLFSLQVVSGFGRGWQKQQDEPRNFPIGQAALQYIDKKHWGWDLFLPVSIECVARAHDPALGHSAKLDPSAGPVQYGRDGFYLHGRANHAHQGQFHTHGSHGCLIPLYDRDVDQFNKLLDPLKRVDARTNEKYVAMLHVIK